MIMSGGQGLALVIITILKLNFILILFVINS